MDDWEVFVKSNSKELRDYLLNNDFILDQNWSEEDLDKGTGIVVTPENRFYVVVPETEPDEYQKFYCYDDVNMFKHFICYYYWHHTTKNKQNRWCSCCGCEGGCNLCENLLGIYNRMLVKYIGL